MICYLSSGLDNALEKSSGQVWEVKWEALITVWVTQGEGPTWGSGRGMEQIEWPGLSDDCSGG